MPTSATEEFIKRLKAFECPSEDAVESLYDLFAQFDEVSDYTPAVSAMFEVIERHPDRDLGSPGPLVHAIEDCGVDAFEPYLIASVGRSPVRLNIWMVNRILNAAQPPARRHRLMEVLKSVASNPKASEIARAAAADFLKFQGERAP